MVDKFGKPAAGRKPTGGLKECGTAEALPVNSIEVTELLGEQQMLRIKHAGSEYTLRITRNGKLILTK